MYTYIPIYDTIIYINVYVYLTLDVLAPTLPKNVLRVRGRTWVDKHESLHVHFSVYSV